MKRNLFAIFLAAMLVVALVFVAAPSTKAAVIKLDADNDHLEVSSDAVIDLNGHNATVYLAEGIEAATLTVIDSANTVVDGSSAGKLTVEGNNITFESAPLFDGMRYLKVENEDGSFSFHPFNLTISQYGLNTLGVDGKGAICLRATFVANNVVRDLIKTNGDYGIYNTKTLTTASAKEKFSFGSSNFIHVYCDLSDSLTKENLDKTASYGAYIIANGETVYSSVSQSITPKTILEQINTQFSGNSELLTEKQMANFANMFAEQPYLYDSVPSIYNAISTTHKCENVCGFCKKCTNTECTEYVCTNKCEGHSITINGNSYAVTSDIVAIDKNISTLGSYRFLIYTPSYTDTGISLSNSYGEAFVLDQYGKIVRIYDGVYGKYYDAENAGVTDATKCTAAGYLSEAFASRQDGEYLLIAPNDGVSITDETTARRFLNDNRTIGATVTLPGIDFTHSCVSVCEHCNKCTNKECTEPICANKCAGHENSMFLTIGAKKYEAVENKWAINQEITSANAANKAVWVFTKAYTGEVNTNGYGVAVVLDRYGKVAKVYDGANGGYWLPTGKQPSANFTVNTYASVAWSELQAGETLVVLPHGGSEGNAARQFGLDCRYLFNQKMSITGITFETE